MFDNHAPVAVREILQRIAEFDWVFHFGPRFFSNLEDADRERLCTAQRLAHQSELARAIYFEKFQLFKDGNTACAYCKNAFVSLDGVTALGSQLLHTGCTEELDRWIYEVTDSGKQVLMEVEDAAIEENETRALYKRAGWDWDGEAA